MVSPSGHGKSRINLCRSTIIQIVTFSVDTAINLWRIQFTCRKYPKCGVVDHTWVAHRWIKDCGLPQYSQIFDEHLVDGRLLNALTKKDLEKHLGIHRKFHQVSILHAVQLLRHINFDKEVRLALKCRFSNVRTNLSSKRNL